MNGSDSQAHPSNPEYSYLPTTLVSPSGKFVRALHLVSNQTRTLKILSPDLARNQAFLGWYTSAVTLSGRAFNVLRLASLIPPKEFAESRWIDVRNGEYVVERLWRDAKLLEIGGGTLEAHQKNITKDLCRSPELIRR